MRALVFGAGLTPRFPTPPVGTSEPEDVITQEAAIRTPSSHTLRVTPLVKEGEFVPQGGAVASLRDIPEIQFVAPMPGRVARIALRPGRKLSEIVLFREECCDVMTHDAAGAATDTGLRHLMQTAGVWPWLRRRPFGGMPADAERPAAIIVMAADTRPFAPDPRHALLGREEAFSRGLLALTKLTDGPIFVCQHPGGSLFERGLGGGCVRSVDVGPRHPQGSAGIQIHTLAPATIERPVWDIHAEDVAALGDLLKNGILPMTRLVHVAGAALREGRLVRTQAGADLRELTQRIATPCAHVLLSGSPLDGAEAHWLSPRDRQVTVLPRPVHDTSPHWLVTALTRSGLPTPIIPTAALTQAFGATLPAAPFVRALSSGDDELAMKLGVLSLLEDDLGLADFVLGGEAHLRELLRGVLDRIQMEMAA